MRRWLRCLGVELEERLQEDHALSGRTPCLLTVSLAGACDAPAPGPAAASASGPATGAAAAPRRRSAAAAAAPGNGSSTASAAASQASPASTSAAAGPGPGSSAAAPSRASPASTAAPSAPVRQGGARRLPGQGQVKVPVSKRAAQGGFGVVVAGREVHMSRSCAFRRVDADVVAEDGTALVKKMLADWWVWECVWECVGKGGPWGKPLYSEVSMVLAKWRWQICWVQGKG